MTSDLLSRPARVLAQSSIGQRGAGTASVPGTATAAPAATAPLLVLLLVLSVLPPIYFFLGETRLSLTRILLLVMFVPLCFQLFSGKAGRIRAADILLFLFSAWVVIVLLYHEGFARLPLAGITVVEMLGGYLFGRLVMRNITDYRLLLRYLLISLIVLFPISVLEFFTDINLLHDLFAPVLPVFEIPLSQSFRNGFFRVSSGFEHPILYGLFCAITVAPLFYRYQPTPVRAVACMVLAVAMTYFSLSSAPLIAAGLCVLLIGWDYVSKGRWKLLASAFVAGNIFLSLASNRGPVVILIDNLTFNAHTAWTRIWIWRYGSAEVMRHPVMGMGLAEDWVRPNWLTSSVDNFWLVIAMRYGFPGIILLILVLGLALASILRNRITDPETSRARTGYVIALTGLYFSLATVHMWGDTSAFLMFFIGAGMWLGTPSAAEVPAAQADVPAPLPEAATPARIRPGRGGLGRDLPTTRFAHVHERPRGPRSGR